MDTFILAVIPTHVCLPVCCHLEYDCILLQYLSRCVVGASLEEPEEEDDARSTGSFIQPPKEGCYEIVGTTKDKTVEKPDYIKELINVSCMMLMINYI